MLRPFWSRIFPGAWLYSLVLFVVLAAMRTYAILGPAKAGLLFLCQFLLMGLLPFVLLHSSRAAGNWNLWDLASGVASLEPFDRCVGRRRRHRAWFRPVRLRKRQLRHHPPQRVSGGGVIAGEVAHLCTSRCASGDCEALASSPA